LGRRRKHTRKRAEEGASGAFMPREGGEMGAPGASPRGEKEGALHHAEERKGGGVRSASRGGHHGVAACTGRKQGRGTWADPRRRENGRAHEE
jgi:hypothetical protein